MTTPLILFLFFSLIVTYVFSKLILQYGGLLGSSEKLRVWLVDALFLIVLVFLTFVVFREIVTLKEYVVIKIFAVVYYVDFKIKYFKRNYINNKYINSSSKNVQDGAYYRIDAFIEDLEKSKTIDFIESLVNILPLLNSSQILRFEIIAQEDIISPYLYHNYNKKFIVTKGRMSVNEVEYNIGDTILIPQYLVHSVIMNKGNSCVGILEYCDK